MDDSLKARLIGAAVLVALAVLLIPELLSGRKAVAPPVAVEGEGRGTRTFTIDLTGATPTQAAAGAAPGAAANPAPAPVLPVPKAEEAPAAEPLPAATTPAVAGPLPAANARVTPSPASTPAPQSSVSSPAVVAPAVPKPTTAAPPVVQKSPPAPTPAASEPKPAKAAVKGGWSVQVGAFGSAAAAGKLVADLKSAGYPAYISPISRGGKTLHRVRVGPEAARTDADQLAARLKGRNLPATVVAND